MTMGDVIWKNMPQKLPKKGRELQFQRKRHNLYIEISSEILIDEQAIRGPISDHERHFVGGPALPQSKYNMADGRHLENRYDVIFRQWVVRFGRNSAARCRITRRLR